MEGLMNNEFERTQKETVVAQFKVRSCHLPGGTDENHEKPVRIIGLRAGI
jgi:hypothetical protein